MTVWKFPPVKWHEWEQRFKSWQRGTVFIEKIIDITPEARCLTGFLQFTASEKRLALWLKRNPKSGWITSNLKTLHGREIQQQWDALEIPGVSVFDFYLHFFRRPVDGTNKYKLTNIDHEVYLVSVEGINPEEHGFRKVELGVKEAA